MLPSIEIRLKIDNFTFVYNRKFNNQKFFSEVTIVDGKVLTKIENTNGSLKIITRYKNVEYQPSLFADRGFVFLHSTAEDLSYKNCQVMSYEKRSIDFHGKGIPSSVIYLDGYIPPIESNKTQSLPAEETYGEPTYEELSILKNCIERHNEIYSKIINKQKFEQDFLELCYIKHIKNKQEKLEFIEESKIYFDSFYKSEHLKEYLESVLTTRKIRLKYKQLRNEVVSNEELNKLIRTFLDNNNFDDNEDEHCFSYSEFIEDIFYNEREFLNYALESIYSELAYCFPEYIRKKYNTKVIEGLYKDLILQVEDTEALSNEIDLRINSFHGQSEELFLEDIKNFITQYIKYEKYYKKLISVYGTNSIEFELTDDKKISFKSYEKGLLKLSYDELNDYLLIYKPVIPFLYSHVYTSYLKKLKPTFKRLPIYFEFLQDISHYFFENHIWEENNSIVQFKDFKKIQYLPKKFYNLTLYKEFKSFEVVLDAIKNDCHITIKGIAEKATLSIDDTKQAIKKLHEKGIITRIGKGANSKLLVLNQLYN